jgi:hypothetical protein
MKKNNITINEIRWDFFLETDILEEVQLGLAAIWDSINTLSILIFLF